MAVKSAEKAPRRAKGLKAFIDFLKAKFPKQHGDIRQFVAGGDLVALHVHSIRDDNLPVAPG